VSSDSWLSLRTVALNTLTDTAHGSTEVERRHLCRVVRAFLTGGIGAASRHCSALSVCRVAGYGFRMGSGKRQAGWDSAKTVGMTTLSLLGAA